MNLSYEWKLIILVSLLITLFSQLPLIAGYATQESEEVFMGIPVHITDANNHLHWMLQAKDGALLFTNKFTSEEVPALIFNPYHLTVGNLSRLTGLEIIVWYHIISILAIFGFLLYAYKFISYFIKDKQSRIIAFLVVSLASGFGAFWKLSKFLFDKWIFSSELWVTDMNIFQSFGHPHFTISMLLILVVFLHAYKSIQEHSTRHAVIAGSFGLLLGFIHIFDIVTIAAVLATWFGYTCYQNKQFERKTFWNVAIIGAMMSPAVLYYLWIILFNPTYAKWNALNQTATPVPWELISGLGILFIFALFRVYKERKNFSFLSIWMMVNVILVYLPINVQRRFLLGIGVPIALLATLAFKDTVLPWIQKQRFPSVLVVIVIILTFTTTIFMTVNQIVDLHSSYSGDYGNVKYLSSQEFQALQWIETNLNNDVIIISPLRIGNHIPAHTNNRVYLGHWAQTIDFENKKLKISNFYQGKPSNIEGDIVWNGKETSTNVAYKNNEITLVYN